MTNTTPLPIVRKCPRCRGDHDELYPDLYCYEILVRDWLACDIDYIIEKNPDVAKIRERLKEEHGATVDLFISGETK